MSHRTDSLRSRGNYGNEMATFYLISFTIKCFIILILYIIEFRLFCSTLIMFAENFITNKLFIERPAFTRFRLSWCCFDFLSIIVYDVCIAGLIKLHNIEVGHFSDMLHKL